MIEVEGPDGKVFEFPPGTPKGVMRQAMERVYGKPRLQELRERVPEYARVGFTDRVLQGATFNFLDELTGAVSAPGSVVKRAITGEDEGKGIIERLGDAYADNRDFQRDRFDLYALENPVASTAADLTGGLLTAAGTLGKAASLPANIARGATAGAGYGALSSAGAAEGGASERGKAAAQGAAFGAALGGAIPVATAAAGAVGRTAGNAIQGYRKPRSYAAQKVSERMSDAKISPEKAASRLDKARRETGHRMALADVAGKPSRDLLRTVSNAPGPARQFIDQKITNRARAQGARIQRLIRDTFADPQGYGRAVDDIVRLRTDPTTPVTTSSGRKTTIGQLWDDARAQPIPFTAKLEEILRRPAGRRALAKAQEIADNEGVPFRQLFGRLDDNGNLVEVRRVPDMRAWHYIKRGLDRVIREDEAVISPFGAKVSDDTGRAIKSLRKQLLDELDAANPLYAEARRASLTAFDADEALRFGRNSMNMTPEQVRRAMKDFSPGQREAAQVGFAEALRDRIDKAGYTDDAVKRIFKSSHQREIARAMFGDNATDFARFQQGIRNEALMRRTYEAVKGNSTTAQQAVDLKEAGGLRSIAGAAFNVATQGPLNAALQWIGSRIRVLGGLTPEVADQIQRILLETDPGRIQKLAEELAEIGRKNLGAAAARDAVRQSLIRAVGIQADELLAVQEVN